MNDVVAHAGNGPAAAFRRPYNGGLLSKLNQGQIFQIHPDNNFSAKALKLSGSRMAEV
jgi:hypothetical protein